MMRARLTDRRGAFIGYCDVPTDDDRAAAHNAVALNRNVLPAVVWLDDRRRGDRRVFTRDPLCDLITPRVLIPTFKEVSHECAWNFVESCVPETCVVSSELEEPGACGGVS